MKARKYRFATREAAEQAQADESQRHQWAILALRCALQEGIWPKPDKVENKHYSALVCAPLSPCGGAVLIRWKGDKGTCSDVWGIDDFLSHARNNVRGLDEEAFAMREIADKVNAVRNRAYAQERERQGLSA